MALLGFGMWPRKASHVFMSDFEVTACFRKRGFPFFLKILKGKKTKRVWVP
jgi:hypothetical protein